MSNSARPDRAGERNSPEARIFYDASGNVVATPGLRCPAPWIVLPSKTYSGRYFFFNTETQENAWSLNDASIKEIILQLNRQQERAPPVVRRIDRAAADDGSTDSSTTLPQLNSSLSAASSMSGSPKATGSLDSFLKRHPLPFLGWPGSNSSNRRQREAETQEMSPNSSFSRGASSMMSLDSNGSSYDQRMDSKEAEECQRDPMFIVIEGLGRGGYSVVVKAQHFITKKNYAMKVIPKNVSNSREKRDNHKAQIRFELQVMTELMQSPFVQRCHHAFESPSSVFFLLDLNSGGDLFHHLVNRIEAGKLFSEKECQILLAEIFLALEHLHIHEIIHRDIKIENIMLDAQGHVKLVDFGLAVEMTAEVQAFSGAGSLIYMAPELIKDKIGGRFTDWWAYGILAHELLTGKTPWSSLTDTVVIKHEIKNKVVLPPATLSKAAIKFVGSLLCHDVGNRLGTESDDEIRSCSFFKSIDWEAMSRLELPPAFIPNAVNVNKEDQDDAWEGYVEIVNETTDGLTGNQWMVGLQSHTKYLL